MSKRVVVTGIGCVSSLGDSVKEMEQNLTMGRSGYREIPADRFPTDHKLYRSHSGFLIKDELYRSAGKDCTRMLPLARKSIDEALSDSKWSREDLGKERVGMCLGTSVGASYVVMGRIHKLLDTGADDFDAGRYLTPILIGNIARTYGVNGTVCSISTACASGTNAIGRAADLIRDGREDVVICGGIDIFTELTYSGFNSLMAISKNKCHPLTVNRDGMSLGDACATLILESYDSALRRGAPIYGEIKGYCTLNEAYHATAPKPDGEFACKCMRNALADAGLDISDVDYVNSHGTGTVKNDTAEICGLEALFAGKADKTLVNSTKGMTGHCLGAAGSIEAIICLLSIRNRTVYADDNGLPYPDSEKLDFVAKNRPDVDIRVAVSNSFGFGGNMASIVISKI